MSFLKKLLTPTTYTVEVDNGDTFQGLNDLQAEQIVLICLQTNHDYHIYQER